MRSLKDWKKRKKTNYLTYCMMVQRKENQRKAIPIAIGNKVFEDSFDAKECYSEEFIFQKLQYIHLNPVSKKWNLVSDLQIMNIPVPAFMKEA